MKRLFIFAGYDKNGVVDITLLHYLQELSNFGDIVFIMDSDTSEPELDKISSIPNVLYVTAQRHSEYDFGSYKRGYQYAMSQNILTEYDWVYFVNDSVYGPLWSLNKIFNNLENSGSDLTGIIDNENSITPLHVQSWFVGLSNNLVQQDFINDFFNLVTMEKDKRSIVLKYEVGLSQCVLRHGFNLCAFMSGQNVGREMFDNPIKMLKAGVPFIKKRALVNIQNKIYLYPYMSEQMVDYIYKNASVSGIKLSNKAQYKTYLRMTIFGIPIFRIYKQTFLQNINYKLYLFDKIPVCKISCN